MAAYHLMHSPQVFFNKKRREAIPEVVESKHVVDEAEQFVRKSFLRMVADVQEFNNHEKQVILDPICNDAYSHCPRLETLKSVADASAGAKDLLFLGWVRKLCFGLGEGRRVAREGEREQ